jgi:ribosomal protein S18 acetylase RimI-like enzyme
MMIVQIKREHSREIAEIHKEALADDFLPSLGLRFLETFYKGVLEKRGVFGFVSIEKGKVNGFVLGTDEMGRFFKLALRANFLSLSLLLFLRIMKKPSIIKNVLATLLYPNKETGPKAELIVVAVDRSARGKGLGRKLVGALEREMKKRKIKKYKLTVTKRNKGANAFYKEMKFRKLSDFNLYGKDWNLLVKELEK